MDWATMHSQLSGGIGSIIVPRVNGKSEHICTVDPPAHPNLGDNAIIPGELEFIAKNVMNARLSYYDVASHSPAADHFIEEAMIVMMLIHGRGNFGDIWPHPQALLMDIFKKFAHKTIIQLWTKEYSDGRLVHR